MDELEASILYYDIAVGMGRGFRDFLGILSRALASRDPTETLSPSKGTSGRIRGAKPDGSAEHEVTMITEAEPWRVVSGRGRVRHSVTHGAVSFATVHWSRALEQTHSRSTAVQKICVILVGHFRAPAAGGAPSRGSPEGPRNR
jgi:hypothetical protein